MFKIFKNEKSYNNGDIIRPWVINQYNKLSLAKFSHKEILSVLDMNSTEIEYIKKQNFIIVNEETVKENKETIKKKSVKENVDKTKEVKENVDKEVKENKETIKKESVKENADKAKEVKENKETIKKESVKENVDKEVKENKKVANTVKEESVEEDPSKWTDEEVIEKALHELTNNMEYQDKEQMSDLLRESFNSDKGLVDIYRNKYIAHYKLVNNNILNNDNKSTKNTKKEDEKEIKSEVIENKEEKGKKVKSEDNKTDDLNIDNETLEMLVDDVYDQYSALFNIKKDSLRNLIISVLKEKPEVLKSNNYYFVCMRLCEIIESLIMENTIEDNEEDDEILKQLNSIVE